MNCPSCNSRRCLPVSGPAWTCVECWLRWPREEGEAGFHNEPHVVALSDRMSDAARRAESADQWANVLGMAQLVISIVHAVCWSAWAVSRMLTGTWAVWRFAWALTVLLVLVILARKAADWRARRGFKRFFVTSNEVLKSLAKYKEEQGTTK